MDILCFGVIIIDHRRQLESRDTSLCELKIIEKAVDLYLGGISIVATALHQMGFETGLMGNVGCDVAGYGIKQYLAAEYGINVDAIRNINTQTSSSFIQLTSTNRFIEHTPGASAELLPTEVELSFISEHKPKLMAIGYSGLLPKLDENDGQRMAEWVSKVQGLGIITALDTHTVPPYQMLKKPVCVTDIFICNREESEGITGLTNSSPEEVVSKIWDMFPVVNGCRYRLFGVAYPEGLQLVYGDRETFTSKWITNCFYGTFVPKDLTGAGDYLRAGIYAYIIKNQKDFFCGRLNVEQAGKYGIYTAYNCIYKGVKSLAVFDTINIDF